MHLYLLLNIVVGLDRSPSPGLLHCTGWDKFPVLLAQLALRVLLNTIRKFKSLRVKVKSRKEVGHLKKVWSVILQ